MNEFIEKMNHFLETDGITIIKLFALIVFGNILVKFIIKILKRSILKSRFEITAGKFVISILNILLYAILFMTILTTAGISTTSLAAVITAVGLALSLALKDNISSFANGLVIVSTKPFKEGDYVEIDGVGGTIISVSMFHIKLVTPDNKIIIMPNNVVVSSKITNYSVKRIRRLDLNIAVAYGLKLAEVKKVIADVVNAHPLVLKSPLPFIRLKEHGASSLNFTVRCWTSNSNYWDLYFDLTENIYDAFMENNIEIPFNQMDVHIKNEGGKDNEKNI